MRDKVLRSNPNKTDLLLQFSSPTMENNISPQQHTSGKSKQEDMSESTSPEPTVSAAMDLQMVMKILQKMQAEYSEGIKEIKKEVRHSGEKVDSKLEDLAAKIIKCENHRTQDMKNLQDQINAIKLTNSSNSAATDQLISFGKGYMSTSSSQHLLRMALDKQIDELKPYYGKKQENVEQWIKKDRQTGRHREDA